MERNILLTLARVTKISTYISVCMAFFPSCTDETRVLVPDDSFVFVTGVAGRAFEGKFNGDGDDELIHTFRILAFDSSTKQCKNNVLYANANLARNIRYPIKKGTYTFVFLANEAVTATPALEAAGKLDDLNAITYPAEAFSSIRPIPMMQTVEVEVLPDGQVNYAGTRANAVEAKLERLATRVDVILKTEDESIGKLFAGVTFGNIPNAVPLMGNNYTGARTTEKRTFMYSGKNDAYFERGSITPWMMKINRIILPANVPGEFAKKENAIVFTVNVDGEYSPSCELKTDNENYRLPKNARLLLTATVGSPLEINMKAAAWEPYNAEWQTAEIRTLNVSHTSIRITDMKGARVSFSSNMPVVRVAERLLDKRETNKVFHDLAATKDNGMLPSRLYYVYDQNTKSGAGYMNIIPGVNMPAGMSYYTLTLIAENADGRNPLKREIEVAVSQSGTRQSLY